MDNLTRNEMATRWIISSRIISTLTLQLRQNFVCDLERKNVVDSV